MTAGREAPTWHQALAYAVTGHRYPELGRQARPDVAQVAEFLRQRAPEAGSAASRLVPADLSAGLGAAQLWAAAAELRCLLEPDHPVRPTVARDRPLTPDEERLRREVPPHHGG